MSRPPRPPGLPPPDDDPPPQQPRFTPRQAPPQSHPHGPGQPASGPQDPPGPPGPPGPSAPQDPPAQPTFTPRPGGTRGEGRRGGKHGATRRGDGRPRPTFTPRDGYLPPPDSTQRAAYPPPTTLLPAPPGYLPQSYPQPFDYPEAPPPPAPPRRGAHDRRQPPPDVWENRTRILQVPAPGTGLEPQPSAGTQPNLARSSQVMALGTLASRLTGFLRTFVFVVALGAGPLADAYNNSNTLPNTVYYLMLGGIFTSVVVPLLVKAAKDDPDRGEGYAERIFTLGAVALFAVTAAATVLAVPLVDLYAGNINGPPGSQAAAEHRVMVI